MKKKFDYTPILFIGPLILILLVFLAIPIIKAATMSFQYWYIAKPSPNGNYFNGFDNYAKVLHDKYFFNSVKITLIYIVVTVGARFIIGFFAALMLNHAFKGRGIARSLLIIPWAVPEVVACLIWILMYDRDYGIINYLLSNLHIISGNVGYLMDTKVALSAAMVVNIWKGFPFVAVMLLAGMQSISKDLFEAAEIDGANAIQKVRHVTIPSIKPVSMIVFLLLIIWTIKDYAIAYVLAKGGPSRATEILTIYIQQNAFKYFDFGKASAAGIILLVVSLFFTFAYFKVLKGGDQEV
jgi:multiple sugar transport system permease protein